MASRSQASSRRPSITSRLPPRRAARSRGRATTRFQRLPRRASAVLVHPTPPPVMGVAGGGGGGILSPSPPQPSLPPPPPPPPPPTPPFKNKKLSHKHL